MEFYSFVSRWYDLNQFRREAKPKKAKRQPGQWESVLSLGMSVFAGSIGYGISGNWKIGGVCAGTGYFIGKYVGMHNDEVDRKFIEGEMAKRSTIRAPYLDNL